MWYLYILLACLLQQPVSWQTCSSIDGRFQVDAPGEMHHSVRNIPTDMGDVEYHTYHFANQGDTSGSIVFLVGFYEFPREAIPDDSLLLIRDFFDATVEQSALAVAGEVLIMDDITYRATYPGRFWRTHYNGGDSVLKTRAYLANGIYYSVQVAVDSKHSLHPDIDRFFDSFRIIDG